YPAEGDAAPRIAEAVPGAKLIYLVRDPVERIVSDYVQQFATGHEHQPLEAALGDIRAPDNWYVCPSRYARQVERYLAHFDSSRLLVLEQWELLNERERTLRRVFEFLDVEPAFWSPNFKPEIGSR